MAVNVSCSRCSEMVEVGYSHYMERSYHLCETCEGETREYLFQQSLRRLVREVNSNRLSDN